MDIGVKESFGFGNDPIVIRKYIAGYQGGKVLNVTGFSQDFIRAGHIIIRNTTTDEFFPLNVTDGAYVALPSGCEYVGVATSTKSKSEPFVGIMYSGEVNDVASPYPVASLLSALKTALPTLVFLHD